MIGREEVEDIEGFVYLGTTVTKEGGGTEDIKKRLSKARGAFFNLKKIWNTRSIGRNTKIKLKVKNDRRSKFSNLSNWKEEA